MQEPDRDPYEDADCKDVVGDMPKFFCAHCNPIKRLLPSEAVRCLGREAPCWQAAQRMCG